ncbi:sugar-binding transcriptional regulator [Dermatophilus congolensis]|uniref:Deoxyribonucleoside regulator n=1 Tax=Dermatophilus congolensis TaxID=1863 RepID=A0A239VF16_9MICO|nr:sugar-binding transcriptional regulator [Dermatophilus congolensis]MBO3128783.1 sugar-binding transcriptional regulator [Dermatophilus congolensis]MBO3132581.1 sugar-binding transcriptional regulator [Dermatophilus congolensis]MBO3133260.1 sugar-binding transcriptional regulator [Dermatophilus congolensis]MBO3135494.1 sugar-binding transcriptional regulator [Dermatophilus congolensis]MBO3137732.1 sugar-binding transcriptional regulator [Dermatophilus congolensis]
MTPRDSQALEVVKLYYRYELSQNEIATRLGISRPTVSKLIQHAKDRGFVTVEIHDPRESGAELADELRTRFGLQEVRLVHDHPIDPELTRELGRLGASMLQDIVTDGDLVGIAWGRSMHSIALALEPQPRRGVQFIQLKGGISLTPRSTNDLETMTMFTHAFNAYAWPLPLPVIFDSPEVKHLVEQDRHIRRLLNLGLEATVAVFTVGAVSQESVLLKIGQLTENEEKAILDHAVGDICSRFFDSTGSPFLSSVDERTIAIPLEKLREKDTRLIVAGGIRKAEALAVALRAGYATHLATDIDTARLIIDNDC